MIDLFHDLYNSTSIENKILKKLRYYSIIRVILRTIANIIAPVYFILTKNNKEYALENCDNHEGRIIVSLTSFPTRISRIWLVMETLLRQTKKPDKIILWLSKEEFSTLDSLPGRLLKLKERGIEIRFVEGNIRSHKKYYYTLQEFPNDYMLNVDDDHFYRSTMVENMFKYSIQYPGSIISQYSRKILWENGKLKLYLLWSILSEENSPNFYSFFVMGGGTLFPPYVLDKEVLNKKLFMSLTPTADDIWLNTMCRLKQTKIVNTGLSAFILPVIIFSNTKLSSINNGANQNNVQLTAVRNYFLRKRGIDPFRIEGDNNL